MRATRIIFQWSPGFSVESFRGGVSLHSHTLHSREPLDFLYRVANHSWLLRILLRQAEHRYQAFHGTRLDLARGWWTPPLAPLDAFTLESDQIKALGLSPLVSLTDHDNIEAPTSLQAVCATRQIPVSIEWTVPVRNTFFHLGVHNLPPLRARSVVNQMQEISVKPSAAVLKETLAGLHASPGTLVVLNHPMWDEKGVGADAHRSALLDLLGQCSEYIHAMTRRARGERSSGSWNRRFSRTTSIAAALARSKKTPPSARGIRPEAIHVPPPRTRCTVTLRCRLQPRLRLRQA